MSTTVLSLFRLTFLVAGLPPAATRRATRSRLIARPLPSEAFYNSASQFENVSQIGSHSSTRRGDYCFIPGWFSLSKTHVMLLGDRATSTGAKVYAHTNNRCGEFVNFEGKACVSYRITDAS